MPKSRPTKDWTWDDLADKIDSEGFDYFFTQWASPEMFTDAQLKKLAAVYVAASEALQKYLTSKGGLL